jgi:hypothetical protein
VLRITRVPNYDPDPVYSTVAAADPDFVYSTVAMSANEQPHYYPQSSFTAKEYEEV